VKVLLSILRELADIPADADEVALALNNLGLAVDGMDHVGVSVPGVVSAKIVRTEKHPEADKVTRCFVDAGDGIERHVWCGANNMGPGDIVPLATLGTTMPDGREISRRGILGIDSEGMLCSEIELGISDQADGLLILPSDAPLGVNPFDILEIEHDVVFDLDLTRNRPDCWGHAGIARDLAAYFAVPYKGPHIDVGSMGPKRSVPVSIAANDECGLFTIASISGVEVGNSPSWVARRLTLLGMRPINNIVDASNLVMLELNQPTHAYDADVVKSFSVRLARSGEKITTLDNEERTLSPDDLVICDADRDVAVGIAGVMGDLHSETTGSTTNLSLETAWFAPDPIRFAAQRHGIRSEASVRFERGVDPCNVQQVVQRFFTIVRETSPNAILHEGISETTTSSCPQQRSIELRLSEITRVLGISLTATAVCELLNPIGYASTARGDVIDVVVPTWRPDSEEEVDLIEEVARHYGYDNIGKAVPKSTVHGRLSTMQSRRRLLRRVLVGMGLDEAMPSPFLAPGDLQSVGLTEDDVLHISNPLAAEESVLRTSLRAGLLRAVQYNISHRAPRIALWEIGHVYPKGDGALPDESEQLCVLVVGSGVESAVAQWNTIADALEVGANLDQSRVPKGLHATRSASLTRGKKIVGVVGEIDPAITAEWGISERISCLELDLTVLLNESPKPVQARDVNRNPSSDLDLAFVVANSVPAQDVHRALRQAAGSSLVFCELFDVYRGVGLPEDSRSLAFHLRLQDKKSTMTDADIAQIRDKCIAAAQKVGASLRT
jgi:phenylalanyl-tRNA synthetase beta chain